MTEDRSAQLLRAISEELAQRLMPELHSADARERASLARLVLDQLAADLDVLPQVCEQGLAQEYRGAIEHALRDLPAERGREVEAWRRDLQGIARESGAGAQHEIHALRSLAATIVRHASALGSAAPPDTALADASDAASADVASADVASVERAIARLGALDQRWLTAYEAAQQKRTAERTAASAAGPAAPTQATAPDPSPASITQYLRRRFPDEPAIEATAVVPVPGGRSKKTFFISLKANSVLPSEIVMRQDYALRYEGTKVKDEYTPLSKLAQRGLPVPRPLLLEAQECELGPPFLFVERLTGGPPGSYLFGVRTPCPGAFGDLVRMLAQLHRIAPAELELAPPPSGAGDSLLRLIVAYEKKWRDNATRASPVIDYAYAWARAECAKDEGSLAIVHGDAGPYNLLVDADRLNALLDWEFVHVGDPAVDLGIVRAYAEDFMSWDELMRRYTDAGGTHVPERRIRLGMLVNFLKGTTLVATSGRNFEEGWTREFVKGANSFTGLRLIELRIAALLKRFGAV